MRCFKEAGLWLGNAQAEEKFQLRQRPGICWQAYSSWPGLWRPETPYTCGHLWRVSRYARLLAEQAKFSEAEAARVGLGGFLHDLDKIGIASVYAVPAMALLATSTSYQASH